jgi:hypothetical protein
MKAVAEAEAITSALVPEADASKFAELGGAALEELVPEAIDGDAVRKAASRQAIYAAGEVVQRFPSMHAALGWLDALQKGQIPVRVEVADLDRPLGRIEAIPRLLAVSIVLTGLLIGSAVAAGTGTGKKAFRADIADTALVLYIVSAAIAVLLASALLWRLVRPENSADRRGRIE